jgi:hypothetical protein
MSAGYLVDLDPNEHSDTDVKALISAGAIAARLTSRAYGVARYISAVLRRAFHNVAKDHVRRAASRSNVWCPGSTVSAAELTCWESASVGTKTSDGYWFSAPVSICRGWSISTVHWPSGCAHYSVGSTQTWWPVPWPTSWPGQPGR